MFKSVSLDGKIGISLVVGGKVQPPFITAATADELKTLLTNAARAIALQVPVSYEALSGAQAPEPPAPPPPVAPNPAPDPAPDPVGPPAEE